MYVCEVAKGGVMKVAEESWGKGMDKGTAYSRPWEFMSRREVTMRANIQIVVYLAVT